MGVVVEATHLQLRDRVAIKLLLPDLVESEEAAARFRREGRVLFKIRSPHVCRVLDIGMTEGGYPFMVMELLDGEDLAHRLGRGERFDVQEAVHLTLQACQGIAEAHARGIVHRDLKPENLFITTDASGETCLKLLDFGLSKVTNNDIDTLRSRKLTEDAQVMGTPHYMAPEQWMSSKDVGPAADQWSLATILFELIAGRPPFPGTQVAKICSQVLSAPTPTLSSLRADIPKGLDAVLRKALEKTPADRYENIGAFAVALSAFARPGAAAEAERTLNLLKGAPHEPEESGRFSFPSPPSQASDMDVTLREDSPTLQQFLARGRAATIDRWRQADRQRYRIAVAMAAVTVLLLVVVAIGLLTAEDAEPDASVGAESPAVAPEDGAERGPSPSGPTVPSSVTSSPEDDTSGKGSSDVGAPDDATTAAPVVPKPAPASPRPRARPKPRPAAKPTPKDDSAVPGEEFFDDRY
jgi:serine/threonine-protein kinase